ncbi:centrosomal protein of 290 kDa-like [Schistocerca americana]|uniref:centrosomal protein of 290 kDa-like n=1 Tax=Schistocerca americana TaxID=7009 RepID=UPI001F4F9B90|nr:centrosomal protein of 290 kDa-like [Schistocerca americana]
MVQIDWKRISAVEPVELTEDEKEDWFDAITECEISSNISHENCISLLRVAQEILKFKGDQVEILVAELDTLSSKLKEKEINQQKVNEDVKGRKQLNRSKLRPEADSLKEELIKTELEVEKLKTELRDRDKELLEARKELEELKKDVHILEEERAELQRELLFSQNEPSDDELQKESLEIYMEKQKEMTELIKQKNKHISELLEDFEELDQENKLLKENLCSVRDKLTEATEHLTALTNEISGYRETCSEQAEKLSKLEEQNAALHMQIKDLVEQKIQRDAQLDQLTDSLNSKVQEWKKVIELKNSEISELKEKVAHLASQAPNAEFDTERNPVAFLTMTIQEQEKQIENLQKQLVEATKEINESATVIEELKSQKEKEKNSLPNGDAIQQLKSQLQSSEEKVQLLEESLRNAEEDAKRKAEETTKLILQLRNLESGESGLAEALSELNDAQIQISNKDRRIEQLVSQLNEVQTVVDNLEDQNTVLREKLNMSATDTVDTTAVVAARNSERLTVQQLQVQLDTLEEQKIELQAENHRLTQKLSKLCRKFGFDTQSPLPEDTGALSLSLPEKSDQHSPRKRRLSYKSTQDHKDMLLEQINVAASEEEANLMHEKLQAVTEENEALRKGMHEILDSIQKQDGSGIVHLEAPVLERLLFALDARHVAGWYHPAMRLQAELHISQGVSAELRDQLHKLRREDQKNYKELQKALLKVDELHNKLAALETPEETDNFIICETEPRKMPLSSAEIIAKLNIQLLKVLNEYEVQEKHLSQLSHTVEQLEEGYCMARHQLGLLYGQCLANSRQGALKKCADVPSPTDVKKMWNSESDIKVRHEIMQLNHQQEAMHQRLLLLQQTPVDASPLSSLEMASEIIKQLAEKLKIVIGEKRELGTHTSTVERNQNEELLSAAVKSDSAIVNNRIQLLETECDYLRGKLLHCVSREEYEQLQKKKEDVEYKIVTLEMEKQKLLEGFEMAECEIKKQKFTEKLDRDCFSALKQLISKLQSDSDDKAEIAKLGQELLATQQKEKSYENIIQQQKNEIVKLQLVIVANQSQLHEKEESLSKVRDELNSRCRVLNQIIENLHSCLSNSETGKNEERVSEPAVPVHSMPVPLPRKRLPDMEILQTRNNDLEKQCMDLENNLVNQRQVIMSLEKEKECLKNELVDAQKEWKATEETLQQQLKDLKESLTEDPSNAEKEKPEIATQFPETPTEYQSEMNVCAKTLESKSVQTIEENRILNAPERGDREEIEELKAKMLILEEQIQNHNCESGYDSQKQQETIEALKIVIGQKDETICHYQKLLQENREESTELEQKLRKEIKDLQSAMVLHSQIHSRLKQKARALLIQARNSSNESYNHQLQQLQLEITDLRNQLAALQSLSPQVASVPALEGGQLKDEKKDTKKEELLCAVQKLIEQLEGAKKDPTLSKCMSLLHAQGSKQEILTKTVSELESDIKMLAEALTHDTILQPEEVKKPATVYSAERKRANRKLQQELQLKEIREEELQKKIRSLEKELQDIRQEQQKEQAEVEERKMKAVRWDERKKWQIQLEKIRKKLQEMKEANEKLEKSNTGLRFTVTRLEREKNLLLIKLSTLKEEKVKLALSAR